MYGFTQKEDRCKHICPLITEDTWNQHKCAIISTIGLAILLVFGLGISVATIAGQSHATTSVDVACPTFPQNLTSYTLEKQIFKQWKWQYNFAEFTGHVNQWCPTVLGGDSEIYLGSDDSLVSHSNQEAVSLVGRTHVYDCHDNLLYQIQSHDPFDAIINGFKILVSYEIMTTDSLGNQKTIGYVKGSYILIDHIYIIDMFGVDVAKIDRDLLGLTCTFTVYNTSSVVTDPRILAKLAAYKSFSEDDSTDGCKSYFWGIVWFLLAVAIGLFLWICYVSWFKCGLHKLCCDAS